MLRRSAAGALMCAVALLAAACDGSPTDPSRPGEYQVVFLGVPAGAESFTPRGVSSGRVVGTARGGGVAWAAQWANGAFTRLGPDVPAECESEALAARAAFTVGQVTCTEDGGTDAYGWAAGVGALPRLFAEPHGFVDISRTAVIAGTLYPTAQFPLGSPTAFQVVDATATLLLPPDAQASEAVGVTGTGAVAVTAYYECTVDEPDCVPSRAALFTGGAWLDVPIPGNAERAVAAAVSSAGHVAGYTIGNADGVFLYELEDDDVHLLPVVPGTRVQITGANALGQVVGTGIRLVVAPGQQPSYGIAWGDGRQYPLSERILGEVRWQVTAALATDDEGHIAGTGVDPDSGTEGAILLIPASGGG
jgi:hypothetical protein